MNSENYSRIKFKYKFLFILMGWAAIAVSATPTWIIVHYLAELNGVDMDAPGIPGAGLDTFDYYVLSVMLANFLLSCALVTYLVAKFNGWSRKQTIDYLFKYENLPSHWLKK
ncbi:hypothetical protein [Catenovulum agarivorans]|uniref:hypothetical protein n=1 Tax=Catenovulum agarivorans TaxID=1172192 RepID=UPI00035CCAE9|nr:hypothetical protein [Catenovulum agarivorans]